MVGGGAEPFQQRAAIAADEHEGLRGDQLAREKNARRQVMGSQAGWCDGTR